MQEGAGEADVQPFFPVDGLLAEEAIASVDPDCLLRGRRRVYDTSSVNNLDKKGYKIPRLQQKIISFYETGAMRTIK